MCSLFGLPAGPRCRSVLLVVPKSIIVVSVFPTPTPFFDFLQPAHSSSRVWLVIALVIFSPAWLGTTSKLSISRTRCSCVSVRNYRSPTRHWRLTFRVGDHQLATWSPKKKKNEKSSSRESFAKKAGRSGASILSSTLPLRFD